MGMLQGTQLEAAVRAALATVDDPDLGRDLVSLGMVKSLSITDDTVAVTIELTTPACPMKDRWRKSSRVCGSERCTSITGGVIALAASSSAIEVCV